MCCIRITLHSVYSEPFKTIEILLHYFSWKQLGGSLDMCCAAQDEIWGVNSDCEIYRKKSESFIDFNHAFDHIGLSEVRVLHSVVR